MPTVHIQSVTEGQLRNGQRVQISPALALQQHGPIVQVVVGLKRAMSTSLLARGAKVPTPLSAVALIDRGASNTCVDNNPGLQLGLRVVDTMRMTSASHDGIEQPGYPINIELTGTSIQFGVPKGMGANLAAQGLGVLIGRDVLAAFTMFYNGPAGQITFSI